MYFMAPFFFSFLFFVLFIYLQYFVGETGVSWTKIFIFGYHGSFSHFFLFEELQPFCSCLQNTHYFHKIAIIIQGDI